MAGRGARMRSSKAADAGSAYRLEDIPNIGPSIADDLRALDIFEPAQLVGRDPYALYARLTDPLSAQAEWSEVAVAGQARFLAGLDALQEAGLLHGFEPGKRAYIGGHD